ncbi:Stp1/IreP family PP2C-type Ser/Thr phosphatase [Limosilactobacillus sp. STM2_1]|uniref:Stp1/IreP family PP2C-type Ser/Thr phosphatase n=1 Tax=Limosilactobacillus rudii TaxID=2759755 RepID=A0A7W3UJJ8_9LACO|nr:Stp1/IreP family PP2C-type Ser/Thr phosphatase [Limosilactobacillus rudii]MBB1080169.1 Stp1/IreP family PP2C-type Ser/Thr phosphatase [Limosilactobacillus rudii]MBB1096684.1 Stp1/IreP family PP2C-type Ser/Thr phosphatase [Limosilactobacillus rudii]MCD7133657.1 Stp1/IreP family PP2C-type Ser/Thr phosphatase [Limosilactobacillus rudii]
MKVAYQTDIGHQRKQNQDRVNMFTNSHGDQLMVIADGIGGNRSGDVAAEYTVTVLGNRFKEEPPQTPLEGIRWFARETQLINGQILAQSKRSIRLQGMGTTMVAAIAFKDAVVVANIGDSRGYILHQNLLTQITVDHSLVNELVKTGDISEDEALKLPQSNIITRAIGISSDAQIEVNRFDLNEGDQLLMCSDGLFKTVERDQIIAVLEQSVSLQEKCARLVAMANKAGGPDNITVLIGINSDQEG